MEHWSGLWHPSRHGITRISGIEFLLHGGDSGACSCRRRRCASPFEITNYGSRIIRNLRHKLRLNHPRRSTLRNFAARLRTSHIVLKLDSSGTTGVATPL
jgi:hypothetical protein